jgi:hypothetical protein
MKALCLDSLLLSCIPFFLASSETVFHLRLSAFIRG